MMLQPAYIRGISAISPQRSFRNNTFDHEPVTSDNNLLRCIEPSYTGYLNPVLARRMGKIVKMGIASALEALKDASVKMPDAIITGTALGCLGDTEKFLKAIIADDEQFLTPVSFIQSIQNTVSAQIALQLNCTGHNFTFVHKGYSFESALLDTLMLLDNGEAETVLTGGLDELTDHNFHIYSRLGIWKKEMIRSTDLLNHKTEGTIAGEGATFFTLCSKPGNSDFGILKGLKMVHNISEINEMNSSIASFLNEYNLNIEDIDLTMMGCNGDNANDEVYHKLNSGLLQHSATAYFKHLCGEYQTSGAFAMWLCCLILKFQTIPELIMINKRKKEKLSHIMIINNYENNFTFYLLEKV